MASEINYEKVIAEAKGLPMTDQLRLISDLSALLRDQMQTGAQARKSSADFYGAMQGITYDEADFEAAEWHPGL